MKLRSPALLLLLLLLAAPQTVHSFLWLSPPTFVGNVIRRPWQLPAGKPLVTLTPLAETARQRRRQQLFLSPTNQDNDEDLYDGFDSLEWKDDGEDKTRPRKRDQLKDWLEKGNSSTNTNKEPVKANFDDMFQDMPKLDEILGDSEETEQPPDTQQRRIPASERELDDSWFDPIQSKIEEKYAAIRVEMLRELDEQIAQDPESVPDNAKLVLETVWEKEMEEEIEEQRAKAAKELLRDYERDELKYAESRDLEGVEASETIRQFQEEMEKDIAQKKAIQARIHDFAKYEEESLRRAAASEVQAVAEGDMDKWALERLEEMLSTRTDDDLSVSDILEENIDELRTRMDKEKEKGSIRPETMKEWQMYRSIATRMLKSDEENGDEAEKEEDEEAITGRLDSWKDYQQKEQAIRRQSGLSSGPEMPFEWQEAGKDALAEAEAPPERKDTRSPAEIREEVNQKAIEAMEDMIRRSEGTPRAESLKLSLEALKSEIEIEKAFERDNPDLVDKEEIAGPVDISDIFDTGKPEPQTFARTQSRKTREKEELSDSDELFGAEEDEDIPDLAPPEEDISFGSEDYDSPVDDTVPDTPFFSENEISAFKGPPPDTPFFFDNDGDDVSTEAENIDASKLGTLDEQKLRAMYRRAGATTPEEQEKIKSQWEQFRTIEKQKRDVSGLSDTDESSSLDGAGLGYDISEVVGDDGEIDAEKILSRIGPRPTRKRSKQVQSPIDSSGEGSIDAEEVADEVFRAVSAVGGGPTRDDPEAKAKEKAAFEEFTRKEEAVRESLDEIDAQSTDGTLGEVGLNEASTESLDDEAYADQVLSSISPRPVRKPKPTPDEYERQYSEQGGVSSDAGAFAAKSDPGPAADELVPESLRGENEGARGVDGFLGREFDDINDEEHERNLRQLREYEERRASNRPRQMGIDISDVFDRDDSAESRDRYDYDDYSSSWSRGRSFSSFDARKASLLNVDELEVRDVNLLMGHKDSVQATGVSQYLPRVNKPFRDFGAIFRLEGTLLDITGMQYEAWTKTAEAHGYKPPRLEDVRIASVMDAEVAARKVFFWTDDFLLCREIARTHRSAMQEVFKEWMTKNCVTYQQPKDDEAPVENIETTSGNDARATVVVDNIEDVIDIQGTAWTKAAQQFGFEEPTLDEVIFANVISPDDAVMKAFKWTDDPSMVSQVVSAYQRYLADQLDSEETGATDPSAKFPPTVGNNFDPLPTKSEPMLSAPPSSPPTIDRLTENDMLEIQYKAWLAIAEERSFEPPTPDEALGAMVLNDPALVIRDGFAWTNDPTDVDKLVESYNTLVGNMVRERVGAMNAVVSNTASKVDAPRTSTESDDSRQQASGPRKEEIDEMQVAAWKAVATKRGFAEPALDDLQAALFAEPPDVIRWIFGWSKDDNVVSDLVSTYESEMKTMSSKYIEQYDLKVEPASTKVSPPAQDEPAQQPSTGELFQAASKAWTVVAEARGYPPPNTDQVQFAMAVGPKDALTSFGWTEDGDEQAEIVDAYVDAVQKTSSTLESGYKLDFTPKPAARTAEVAPPPYTLVRGAGNWLQSLLDVEMQLGLISFLERDQVDVLLQQTGLDRFFPADKRITASNGYRLPSQQMLGAALRVERRPDHCVVFDVTPESSVAAHDVNMKSVCMIGIHPMYELLSADSTARYFDQLTAMNVRRLFAERVYDQPLSQTAEDRPQNKKQPKTRTRFWEEGDRD